MTEEEEEYCPGCEGTFRGGPIPDNCLAKGYYGDWDGKVKHYYSTKLGIQVQGVYDGILIWNCDNCNYMWPRFSEEDWERLHKKALEIINEWESNK